MNRREVLKAAGALPFAAVLPVEAAGPALPLRTYYLHPPQANAFMVVGAGNLCAFRVNAESLNNPRSPDYLGRLVALTESLPYLMTQDAVEARCEELLRDFGHAWREVRRG